MRFAAVALILMFAGAAPRVDTSRFPLWKLNTPPPPPPPPSHRAAFIVQNLTITQPLDHFDSNNTATWQQRYFVTRDFYKPGGPVLVWIGGESAEYPRSLLGGLMPEIAEDLAALEFSLEHRYYGKSRPTPDTSAANLKYLSTPQALEDLANFIRTQKASDPALASARWVVFGGSYAGNLAAWARLKYPDLIDGAVSSSGPVLAKADFFEYLEVVNNSLYQKDPQCVSDIQAAVAEIERLLQTPDGIETLKKDLPFCETLNASDANDIAVLFSAIVDVYAYPVQYNDPYFDTIGLVCYQTTDSSKGSTPYQRISSLLLTDLVRNEELCLHNFQYVVDHLRNTSWDSSNHAYRQWTYQTCTEFGYFQTTNSAAQPFGNRVTFQYYIDLCSQVFGPQFDANRLDAGVSNINSLYGGLTPQVTNVVFVHGSLDPWHALGILSDLSPEAPAIFVPDESHCADLRSTKETCDRPEMLAAMKRIGELVRQWTSE